MFGPTNFDAWGKYPIVDYIYPDALTGAVGSRSVMLALRDYRELR